MDSNYVPFLLISTQSSPTALLHSPQKERNKRSIVPSSIWDHLPTPAYVPSSRSKECV